MKIFDSNLRAIKKARAVKMNSDLFLLHETANDLCNRINPNNFDSILELGSFGDIVANKFKDKFYVQTDIIKDAFTNSTNYKIVMDEEHLCFKEESFDLVISNLVLHNINDLPGTLIQINKSLKKNGVFIASIFGHNSLIELKEAIYISEMNLFGGTNMRVHPSIEIKDLGNLLSRAKFSMPVTDSFKLTVTYDSLEDIISDLRSMGQTNILLDKKNQKMLSRDLLNMIKEYYHQNFLTPDGLKVTFEIITMTGIK